jgi:RNA polymerase sigma factor (sigma-70 family)
MVSCPPTMSLLLDNEAALAAFRRGDRSVLEALYHAHVDEVAILVRRGFFYSRDKQLNVPGIADEQQQYDLIQETFLRGFSETARRSYNGLSPFRVYLLRIAKNLLIDRLRRRSKEAELPGQKSDGGGGIEDILDKQTPFLPENPGLLAHRRRQTDAVADFVAGLSIRERDFYQKRYVLEFSQEKTAAVLNLSRRKIRTMEKKLCENLKKYLKSAGLWP